MKASPRNPAAGRESKRHWAWMNQEKVRESNRNYRLAFRQKTNRQAAERMRRYRARIKKQRG
jgi:hypothetical protein